MALVTQLSLIDGSSLVISVSNNYIYIIHIYIYMYVYRILNENNILESSMQYCTAVDILFLRLMGDRWMDG